MNKCSFITSSINYEILNNCCYRFLWLNSILLLCSYCAMYVYKRFWLYFTYPNRIFLESFEFCLTALSGKSVRINIGFAKCELFPRESTRWFRCLPSNFEQRRKYLRQYVLLQIKFYSVTQTYFFTITMLVSNFFSLLILT